MISMHRSGLGRPAASRRRALRAAIAIASCPVGRAARRAGPHPLSPAAVGGTVPARAAGPVPDGTAGTRTTARHGPAGTHDTRAPPAASPPLRTPPAREPCPLRVGFRRARRVAADGLLGRRREGTEFYRLPVNDAAGGAGGERHMRIFNG